MLSKEIAKEEIKKLVALYEKYAASGELGFFKGKEENTKRRA
ncbi:MAG: hypothetical protein ABIB71_01110 [Candidatus Woesearchaeota archaeon]